MLIILLDFIVKVKDSNSLKNSFCDIRILTVFVINWIQLAVHSFLFERFESKFLEILNLAFNNYEADADKTTTDENRASLQRALFYDESESNKVSFYIQSKYWKMIEMWLAFHGLRYDTECRTETGVKWS